ncbi:SPOR domain-containing protein [Marinomonas sp. RS-M-Aa-14]|uniref:SPOR domain-containing protein n=1 Tax=Marinomonas sp. RS-M-Aa-14 TaxID=3241169 RepID=UPI00390C7E91
MEISKKLVVIMAGLSLGACSSMDEKNTFMTYTDLQDKVRMHEEQWQAVQPKLDRIDELEAEIAALKQGKPLSSKATARSNNIDSNGLMADENFMGESVSAINVAPAVVPAPLIDSTESEASMMAQEATPLASSGATADEQYGVQVASYGNRDEAVRGWRVLLESYPTSFDGLVPLVNQKNVNGRTMYQLKVGPFVNKSYSADFCRMLKERGRDCLLTQYNGEVIPNS